MLIMQKKNPTNIYLYINRNFEKKNMLYIKENSIQFNYIWYYKFLSRNKHRSNRHRKIPSKRLKLVHYQTKK